MDEVITPRRGSITGTRSRWPVTVAIACLSACTERARRRRDPDGDVDLAYDLHKQALHIAGETGDRHEQARAHEAVARIYRQSGQTDAADHDRRAVAVLSAA